MTDEERALEAAKATIQALRMMKFGTATISNVTVEGQPITINLDEATVNNFWNALLDQAHAFLKGGEGGGEAPRCPACHENYCTVNEGCIAVRLE